MNVLSPRTPKPRGPCATLPISRKQRLALRPSPAFEGEAPSCEAGQSGLSLRLSPLNNKKLSTICEALPVSKDSTVSPHQFSQPICNFFPKMRREKGDWPPNSHSGYRMWQIPSKWSKPLKLKTEETSMPDRLIQQGEPRQRSALQNSNKH